MTSTSRRVESQAVPGRSGDESGEPFRQAAAVRRQRQVADAAVSVRDEAVDRGFGPREVVGADEFALIFGKEAVKQNQRETGRLKFADRLAEALRLPRPEDVPGAVVGFGLAELGENFILIAAEGDAGLIGGVLEFGADPLKQGVACKRLLVDRPRQDAFDDRNFAFAVDRLEFLAADEGSLAADALDDPRLDEFGQPLADSHAADVEFVDHLKFGRQLAAERIHALVDPPAGWSRRVFCIPVFPYCLSLIGLFRLYIL